MKVQLLFLKLFQTFKCLLSLLLKLSCDSRFRRAFTAYVCVFKLITLVVSNQHNYFENANACIKRTLKTTVATQLDTQALFFKVALNTTYFIN